MFGKVLEERYGKHGLVGRDPIAVINEYCPYPYDQFTLSDIGIDTSEIDQKMKVLEEV